MDFAFRADDIRITPTHTPLLPTADARAWLAETMNFPIAGFEYVSRDSVLPSLDVLGEEYGWTRRDGTEVKIRDRDGPGIASQLVRAIHEGYARHTAVVLRPEVIWYAIVNQVSRYVKDNSDRFASVFTAVPGQKQHIEILADFMVKGAPVDGHTDANWSRVCRLFRGALIDRVPGNALELWLPKFSTSTDESDAATLVCFMDAASKYYSYGMTTMCGFPSVALAGTPSDWALLVRSAAQLARQVSGPDIERWWMHLLKTLDRIGTAACGDADHDGEFIRALYKIPGGSGGPRSSGWLVDFVLYDMRGKLRTSSHVRGGFSGDQIASNEFPSYVNTVDVMWTYYREKIPLKFAGGVTGVDLEHGAYVPRLGYAVATVGDVAP